MSHPDDEITTKDALALLGLSDPSSISAMVRSRKLTPTRRAGMAFLFRRGDVEAVAEARLSKLAESIERLADAKASAS